MEKEDDYKIVGTEKRKGRRRVIFLTLLIIFLVLGIINFIINIKYNENLFSYIYSGGGYCELNDINKEDNNSNVEKNVYILEKKDIKLNTLINGNLGDLEKIRVLELEVLEKQMILRTLFSCCVLDSETEYEIEIKNADGKVLAKTKENVSEVIFDKIDLNSKITVTVSRISKRTNEIVRQGSVQIDFATDLIQKPKREYNYENFTWNDLSFEIDLTEEPERSTTLNYYSENDKSDCIHFFLTRMIGNEKFPNGYIGLVKRNNINNLTLDQYIEQTKIIEQVGAYGISDAYWIPFSNSTNGGMDEVILNHEEMLKFAQGQTITKDGKNYSKNQLDKVETPEYKDEKRVTLDGIETHCWVKNGDMQYVFLKNENIYEIDIKISNEGNTEEISNFIKTLRIAE